MLNVALWWMFRFACTTYFDYLAGAGPEASRRCVATRVGGFTLCDSRRGTASCTESCRAFGAQASDSVHCNRPGLVGYSFRTTQAHGHATEVAPGVVYIQRTDVTGTTMEKSVVRLTHFTD